MKPATSLLPRVAISTANTYDQSHVFSITGRELHRLVLFGYRHVASQNQDLGSAFEVQDRGRRREPL